MRVATWNVNSVVRRLNHLLDWLERTQPDVIALQELKATADAFPAQALADVGYQSLVVGERSWNGVALLARQELVPIIKALPGDASDKQARYLEAAVDGVLYCCLYLPNGNPQPGPKFTYKLQWFERLKKRAAELMASGQPVVLLGDWNVVPTDSDIYKPDSWRKDALLQPESRQAFAELLAQGWTDVIKKVYPDQVPYTFWDFFRKHWERDAGLRIDHILISDQLQVVDAGVDREERGRDHPSDHAPVWAELRLKKKAGRSRKAAAPADKPATKTAAKAPAAKKTKPAAASMRPTKGPDLSKAVKAPFPEQLAPQLATLTAGAPTAGEWIVENKWDGYRITIKFVAGKPRLITRNGNDWTAKLKPLASDLEKLGIRQAWLDGEMVVMNESGVPDFNRLQNAIDNARTQAIVLYLFDAPFVGDQDLRDVPLRARREVLKQLLAENTSERIRFSDELPAAPAEVLSAACQLGLEGVMLKKADSPYVGRRSDTWLKLKCQRRQEFVVIGFTDRTNSPNEVGALILGYFEGGKLRPGGSVGTGWSSAQGGELHQQLVKLETKKPAVDPALVEPGRWSKRKRGTERWVRPEMVVEVAFGEWTPDGNVRHPTFRGVRTDKPATAIQREKAAPAPAAKKGASTKTAKPGRALAPAPARHSVKITHPDRVIDPSTGLTKIELVRFYEAVADRILPHLQQRPVSLVRAPQGIDGQLFFQKHSDKKLKGITELDEALWPGHDSLMSVDTVEGLITAAQLNVVEFHTWNSTARRIDQPDRVVFDLDPGEGVTWAHLQEAAMLVRTMLEHLELQSWLKTSGGKGLHVVVPLAPRLDYDQVKDFSRAVVAHMAKTIPQRFVAKSGGSNRVGKIFIDYLRNGHGQTTAAAFSARARPGLGVSIPVSWDQLSDLKAGAHWTITTAPEYLASEMADPWADYWKSRQSLTEGLKLLGLKPARKSASQK